MAAVRVSSQARCEVRLWGWRDEEDCKFREGTESEGRSWNQGASSLSSSRRRGDALKVGYDVRAEGQRHLADYLELGDSLLEVVVMCSLLADLSGGGFGRGSMDGEERKVGGR